MKRTPLRRGGTLARRTPLRSKRTPAKPRRKPGPSRDEWQAKREALYARAGGRCEWAGCSLDHHGLEAHHRMLRSQGGHHGLDNLAALCPKHHLLVHAQPALAKSIGFIVSSGGSPADRVLHLWDGRTVRLTPDGVYDTCWTHEGDAA